MVSAGDGLSIVIVNHRREDLLIRALDALRGSEHAPDEVVIVDVEPTRPLEASLRSNECLLVIDDNPGYSAACNRGAGLTSGGWVLFLNDDVFVEPGCLGGVLAEATADDSIGIATCRLTMPDGELDHACHRGLPTVFDSLVYKARLDRLLPQSHRLGHYRLSWLDPGGVHDVEACAGAFLLIRRDVFQAVGGWDEAYHFYAEDLDLCARVRAAGYRVRYVGTQQAVHVKGGSSHFKARADDLTEAELGTRDRARVAAILAHERFYEQHMEAATARPIRPLVRLMYTAQRRRARVRR